MKDFKDRSGFSKWGKEEKGAKAHITHECSPTQPKARLQWKCLWGGELTKVKKGSLLAYLECNNNVCLASFSNPLLRIDSIVLESPCALWAPLVGGKYKTPLKK